MEYNFKPDKSYKCTYPFVQTKVPDYKSIALGSMDPPKIMSWVPGTDIEYEGYGDYVATAHGLGERIFHIISIHKPGKYPERVFYLQRWKDPDGKIFGKNHLRITTTTNLKRLLKGHRWGFEIDDVEYDGSECKYGQFY